MKRFTLSKDEKKLIREKYYSKEIITEQKNFLSKLFGSSVDDIFKGFGDDAVKSLDDLFGKVLSKPTNIAIRKGNTFVRSASGSEIPMETIKEVIELVGTGKIQANQVMNYLPRNLADGTEFRSVIQKAFESKGAKQSVQSGGKNIGQVGSKLPIGKIGEDFKSLAQQMQGWIQVKNVIGNMSGWKFHIYADNLDEVAFLYEKLLPVVNKYGSGFKVAGSGMLDRLSQNAVQKGKGVTLYLPSSVVAKGKQKEFLSEIQSAIKGYEKSGQISGDRMITNNIGYRYELSKPIDPSKGVDFSEYQQLYKANEGGGHNVQGNNDLF